MLSAVARLACKAALGGKQRIAVDMKAAAQDLISEQLQGNSVAHTHLQRFARQ